MKYTLVKRGHPRYPERGKKVYACAQYEKTLSMDELLDYITFHGSSFRKGDYKAVISTIAEAMAEMMAEGYTSYQPAWTLRVKRIKRSEGE